MSLSNYLLLFFIVFLSGISFFSFKNLSPKYLKLILTFSAAYLFALSVAHLIPEVYSSSAKNIGVFVFLGFFLQIVLEIFSEGIEHGHIHVHKSHVHSFPLAMIVGLCIHSFLEGMPLVQPFSDDHIQHSLLAGIILHHIPVALALMSMLTASGIKQRAAVFYLLLFAVMAPAGAMTSQILSETLVRDLSSLFDKLMAIVIGIFLHISTTILFESYEEHRLNYFKLALILAGGGLAFLTF